MERRQHFQMDALKNYEKLVYPAWVQQLIAGGNPGTAGSPPTYSGKPYVIVHASSLYWPEAKNPDGYNPNADYESGHIPGAINIPLHTFDIPEVPEGIYPWTCPEDGNLKAPEKLKAAIESYGITHDTMVIVYSGDESYISGAYRVAWALMYAGVADVRYLNGDLDLWRESGGEIETVTNTPIAVEDFGATVPAHPEYYATTAEVEEMVNNPEAVIGDDRRWNEYASDDESLACGYEFFCVTGHIATAVWVKNQSWYLDNIYSGNDENSASHPATMRSYTEIQKMWSDVGITTDTEVAFHCGGGWRSSHVWFCAYLMGYEHASNYDGGWYEWTWDPSRPVVHGENPSAE